MNHQITLEYHCYYYFIDNNNIYIDINNNTIDGENIAI